MTNSMSNADRLFDDDDLPPPHAVSHRDWARVDASRALPPTHLPRLAAPEPSAYAPPLRPAQRACYEALSLALQEGHVFAAVSGPAGSGKTMVLDSVLADRQNRSLRCIRISDPDKVPARLAAQIEEVAYAEAGKPENLERHVVLAVDDAHTASDDLLRCLARLAAMREPGRRVPQVLLVGRPELWHRLSGEEFAPLARRIAIRAVLPPLEDEIDPWASLEQEVSQTMSDIRAERALFASPRAFRDPSAERSYAPNYLAETEAAGLPLSDERVSAPMEFALFPDPPPRKSRSERNGSRLRLVVPVGCLMLGIAMFGFLLSYYEWPDLLGEMPWSKERTDNTGPYVFSPEGSNHGLPRPLGWSQPSQKHSVAGSPNPYAPATAEKPVAAAAAPTVPDRSQAAATPAPVRTVAVEPPAREPVAEPAHAAALPLPAPQVVQAPAVPVLAAPPSAVPANSGATPSGPASPSPAASRQMTGLAAPLPTAAHPAPLPAPVIALMLRRGDEHSSIGDIFAARLLYERAAEAGSAQGALRLARTYDAAFLPFSNAPALGDPAAAKRWYARAVALGDKEAATRLKAINEGR